MLEEMDRHALRRAALLEPVAELCGRAGLAMAAGEFRSRFGPPVAAVRCAAADGSWDAAVTVVRARGLPPNASPSGRRYARDPRTGYDLDSEGELVYEVQISEDDDGGSGHGPRPLAGFDLVPTPQAAADVLILWVSRESLFRCQLPVLNPDVRMRWERRCYEHRQATAAAAKVHAAALTPAAAGAAAAVDPAALCWHFPRERSGRYLRSAAVALTPCDGARPHLRGRWLTARAVGERLVLEVTELIAANQPHRWDDTPWLWDRHHAGTPLADRWQAARPADVEPVFEAQRRGLVIEALALAGVRTDPQLTRLLAGLPTRLFRSALTATWVTNLYAGLADAAPWRLAAAHQVWRQRRQAVGLPAGHPVVLFGLGGLGQARKPKVALDVSAGGPVLRMIFTGSNAVLPRSLWTLPADLAACLYGWPAPPGQARLTRPG